jgi:hypothetical protein
MDSSADDSEGNVEVVFIEDSLMGPGTAGTTAGGSWPQWWPARLMAFLSARATAIRIPSFLDPRIDCFDWLAFASAPRPATVATNNL